MAGKGGVKAGEAYIEINLADERRLIEEARAAAKQAGEASERELRKSGGNAGGAFGSAFRRRVTAALSALPDAQIGADTSEADREIQELRARLARLKDVSVGVDIDEGAAIREIDYVAQRLRALGAQSASPSVRVNTAAAAAQLSNAERQVDRLDGKRAEVKVRADTNNLRSNIFLAQQSLAGLALAASVASPAIVAALAGATAAAGALLGPLAAAAAGFGALAAAAVPSLNRVSEAVKAQDQAQKELAATGEVTEATQTKLRAAMDALSPSQRRIASGFHSMKAAYEAWSRSLEPATAPLMIRGMQLLERLLPRLTPLVRSAAAGFNILLADASRALNAPFWRGFFDYLARIASPAIVAFGRIFGNVFKGFAGVMMAFEPLTGDILSGLVRMSAAFARWGGNLGQSQGFREFVAYVRSVWPDIKELFSSLGAAIRRVSVALAPLAKPLLRAASAGLRFVAAMPPGAIVGIAGGLLGVAAALKAVGVAGAIASKGLKANLAILAVAALAGLVIWLVRLYQTNEDFRESVDKAFGKLKELFAPVGAAFGKLQKSLGTLKGPLKDFGEKVMPTIQRVGGKIAKTVSSGLTKVIGVVSGSLIPAFKELLPVLAPVAKFLINTLGGAVAGALKGVFQILGGAVKIISGIFKTIAAVVRGDWSAAWEGVKMIFRGVWDVIKGIFNVVWNLGILKVLKLGLKLIKGLWSKTWTGIRNFFTGIWNGIKKAVKGAIDWVKRYINVRVSAIRSLWNKAWTGVSNFVKRIWTGIRNFIAKFITGIRNTIRSVLTTIRNVWNSVWTWIRNRATGIWKAIRDYISRAIGQARDRIRNVLTSVRNIWKRAWDWIRARGRDAWKWIDKWIFGPFKQGLSRLQTAFGNVKDAIGRLWNQLKKKVRDPIVAVVNTVYNNGIRKAWNTIAGKVGLDDKKLPEVTVPAFRTGGAVFGPGTSTSDSIPARLSHDEHVVTAREVAGFGGHRRLEQLRSAARNGRWDYGMHSAEQPFKKGGRVTPLRGRKRGNTYAGHSPAGARDYPAPTGTPVRATEAGRVTQSRFGGWAGGHVRISHRGGWETLYAHLSKLFARRGQEVVAGSKVGNVGNTGNSFGSHLHMNAFKNGKPVEFHNYLNGAASGGGFLGGIGELFGGVWNKAKSAAGFVKNSVSDVIADLKENTGKVFNRFVKNPAMDKLRGLNLGKEYGAFGHLAAGVPKKGVGMLWEGVQKWVKSLVNPNDSASGDVDLDPAKGSNKAYIKSQMKKFGWGDDQWPALHKLVQNESGWRLHARNPSSGAYGLFQSLPASKIDKYGNRRSVKAQAGFGLNYIKDRYSSPKGALRAWNARSPHWYDSGGWLEDGDVGVNDSGKPEPVFSHSQWEILRANLAPSLGEFAPSGGGRPIKVVINAPEGVDVNQLANKVADKIGRMVV